MTLCVLQYCTRSCIQGLVSDYWGALVHHRFKDLRPGRSQFSAITMVAIFRDQPDLLIAVILTFLVFFCFLSFLNPGISRSDNYTYTEKTRKDGRVSAGGGGGRSEGGVRIPHLAPQWGYPPLVIGEN